MKDTHVSPDSLGKMLRNKGMNRGFMVKSMKSLMKGSRYLALDLPHVLSMREGNISATLGYNSTSEFLPQGQLALLYSLGHEVPSYFRVLPGVINSLMSQKVTKDESGPSHVVFELDTGFYSGADVKSLESMIESYVMPQKRNSRLIDYSFHEEKRFVFHDQPIFYWKYGRSGRFMYTFRNNFLKAEEEKNFFRSLKSSAKFKPIKERMGTISVVTNMKVSSEIVYDRHKSGMDVCQFHRPHMHYRIYALLKKHVAVSRYSRHDMIEHLEQVHMPKIGEE